MQNDNECNNSRGCYFFGVFDGDAKLPDFMITEKLPDMMITAVQMRKQHEKVFAET
jgi:hypothetical protein